MFFTKPFCVQADLLFLDENYEVKSMYDSILLDLNYNKIALFKDASRSTNGPFLQFNNYLIKSNRYISLLP